MADEGTGNPKVAIFDIDGTIADTTHRQHFMERRPKDWDGFYGAMADDTVREPVADLLRMVSRYYPIILCSGRPSTWRDVTSEWLCDNRIPWDTLYMRKEGDRRDDTIVKREMLQTIRLLYEPAFVVDDRKKVVDMWRSEGLVCFQCDVGNF
jgi:hypothetical protein